MKMSIIQLYKGDNLEILEKYKEEIKPNIVYLDPPYNTKNSSLLYKDTINSEAWYKNFLILIEKIKNVIQKDAIIFTSIGMEELAHSILALKEVFGKSSIVSIVPRRTHSGHKTSKVINNLHDFVVIVKIGKVEFNGIEIDTSSYKLNDEFFNKRGFYQLRRIDYKDFKWSKTLDFPFKFKGKNIYAGGVSEKEWKKRQENPKIKDWSWIWSEEKINFALKNGYVEIKNNRMYKKTYLNSYIEKTNKEYKIVDIKRTKSINSLHFIDKKYSRKKAQTKTEKLFDYPKSDELIKDLINLPKFKKKIVLDPFGGTGVTAIVSDELNVDKVYIIQKNEEIKKNSRHDQGTINNIFELMVQNIKEQVNNEMNKIKIIEE